VLTCFVFTFAPEYITVLELELCHAHTEVDGGESVNVLQYRYLEAWTFVFVLSHDPYLRLLASDFEKLFRGSVCVALILRVVCIFVLKALCQEMEHTTPLWHDVEAELDLLLFVDVSEVKAIVLDHQLWDVPVKPRVGKLHVEMSLHVSPLLLEVDTVDHGQQVEAFWFEVDGVLQRNFVALIQSDQAVKGVSGIKLGFMKEHMGLVARVHVDKEIVHLDAAHELDVVGDLLLHLTLAVLDILVGFSDAEDWVKISLVDDSKSGVIDPLEARSDDLDRCFSSDFVPIRVQEVFRNLQVNRLSVSLANDELLLAVVEVQLILEVRWEEEWYWGLSHQTAWVTLDAVQSLPLD